MACRNNGNSLTLLDRLRLCLPGSCLLCGSQVRRVISLCQDCESRMPRMRLCCGVCGVAVSTTSWTGSCGRCLLKPPPFTLCRGVFHYQSPVSKLLTDFKYHARFACGRALAWQLAGAFLEYYDAARSVFGTDQLPQLLIPIPLHSRRLRQRGFNQAQLLSEVIAARTAVPMTNQLLTRTRYTEAQSQLHASKRAVNLSNAFSVTGQLPDPGLRHIAVIDDVITTTATARAATRALLSAGAERVDVWAAARA